MTAPEPDFTVNESEQDFGPDASASGESTQDETTVKVNTKSRGGNKKNANLGNNKKRGSGVRKLTKADHAKIADMYRTGAFGVMPFNPQVAQVVVDNAEQCADAWYELADENDNVRRMILAMLEGSAWSKLLAAHMPIIIAAVPHDMLPMQLQGAFGNVGTPPDDASSLDENGNAQ